MSDREDVWGQLFSGHENNYYLISKKQFIIGKAKDCDLHLESHLISDKHCYLLRDDNGQVWLYDTSSSGTLLNQRQKSKEKTHYEKETKWITNGDYGEIEDGDEFVLCHNEHPANSLNFTFYKVGSQSCDSNIMVGCRESDSASDSSRSRKREASDEKCSDSSRSRRRESDQDQCGDRAKKTKTSESENVDKSKPTTSSNSSSESTDETNNCKGKMEDALTCSICQDIFHDCISVQPCMHSFCGGCYAPWMKKSNTCPTCRLKVLRISKNHIVNNLVDAFLCQYPNKKRSDTDLKELDSRNTITQDMLYPKREQNAENAEGNENYPMILVGGVWTHIPDINYRFPTQNELDELWNEQHLPGHGGESSDAESDGWWRNNSHPESDLIIEDDSDYVPSSSPESYASVSSLDLTVSDNFSNPAGTPSLSENSWSTAEDYSNSLLPVAEDSDNDSAGGGSENRRVPTLSENSWASAEYESNAADSFSEHNSLAEDSDNESVKVESGILSEDSNNSEVNENSLSEASDNESKEDNASSTNTDASNSGYESL